MADTSAGLKKYITLFTPLQESIILKDQIWKDLLGRYKVLKTTYPKNYSGLAVSFSYLMEKHNIEKTNIVKLSRINRKAVAEAKYHLYDNFRKKYLAPDTVYAVDNLGHLRHLKLLLKAILFLNMLLFSEIYMAQQKSL